MPFMEDRPTAGSEGSEDDPTRSSARHRNTFVPERILADYDYLHDLASGSQADLIHARHRETGQEVTIKIYRCGGLSADPGTVEVLRTRASRAHVAPILEWGEDGNRSWEVMDYFPLGDLSAYVRRRGGLSSRPDLVREVLVDLADAIEHIHHLGVWHRDLKPANVLVRSEDEFNCVLTDFGLARTWAESNTPGSIVGTTAYLAPEAFEGRASQANDWWGLGVIIYELLVGRPLFSDSSGAFLPPALIYRALMEHSWSLEEVPDARWRLLLQGLLTPDYKDRWRGRQVQQWLAGGTPECRWWPNRTETPLDPFVFAGQECRGPEELAAALGVHWPQACELLGGNGSNDLKAWLNRTSVGTGVDSLFADLRDRRVSPAQAALRLQTLLQPRRSPRVCGRTLDRQELWRAGNAAAAGDAGARQWIYWVRRDALLGTVVESDLRLAEGQLDQWWSELAITEAALRADSRIAPHVDAAERQIEGPLLLAALDFTYADRLRGRELAALRESADHPLLTNVPEDSLPQVLRARALAVALPADLDRTEPLATAKLDKSVEPKTASPPTVPDATRVMRRIRRRDLRPALLSMGLRTVVAVTIIGLILLWVDRFNNYIYWLDGTPAIMSHLVLPVLVWLVGCFAVDVALPGQRGSQVGYRAGIATAFMLVLSPQAAELRVWLAAGGFVVAYALANLAATGLARMVRHFDTQDDRGPRGWLLFAAVAAAAGLYYQVNTEALDDSLGLVPVVGGPLPFFVVGWLALLAPALRWYINRLLSWASGVFWLALHIAALGCLFVGLQTLLIGLILTVPLLVFRRLGRTMDTRFS